VASFNIRHGFALDVRHIWPLRRRAAVATLRLLDADVIGLQEAYGFQLRALLRALPGYRGVGEGRAGGGRGERCPVLNRRGRFRVLDQQTRWYGRDGVAARPHRLAGASAPRITTAVTYADAWSGNTFRVLNTHLDEHRAELRAHCAAQLAGWIDQTPTIVLGDLNTPDEVAVLRPLTDVGLRSALPPDAPGTAHGYRSAAGGPRLDHILVSAEFDVLDAAVVQHRPTGRYASDHWPVRATLRWRSGPGPTGHAPLG
jgi:endonuclease/exonuclease/phosphatase family metal-dependent hydrolase